MAFPGKLLLILLLVSGSLTCTSIPEDRVTAFPVVVERGAIGSAVEKLGDNAFSYSGIAFFNSKLIAGTNIGVLEIDLDGNSRLFKWTDFDDVVEEPWLDTANSTLWFLHSNRQTLVRYSREGWSEISLPGDVELTRADMLNGIKGVGAKTGFWLRSTNAVWRWNDETRWTRVRMPEFDCSFNILDPTDRPRNSGCFAAFLPFSDKTFVVTHWRPISANESGDTPTQPDRVSILEAEGDLVEVNIPTPSKFIVDESMLKTSNDNAFAPSRTGGLIQISPNLIDYVNTPGKAEALTISSEGHAIAYFPGHGIFEWNGKWEKLFAEPEPYSPDFFYFLAKDTERLAFATTPKRPRARSTRSQLWISEGKQLVENTPF
jgi:hypothetical protein